MRNRRQKWRISFNQHGEVDSVSRIDGRVEIGRGAKIIGSTIRGPAIVGEEAIIENSFVGPFTSIQDHCEIRGSEIQHSIVLRGSQLLHLNRRVEDSLIGTNTIITRSDRPPQAYRFLVGDNSLIDIY